MNIFSKLKNMPKTLTVVSETGTISIYNICKLVYLLILGALALLAAMAINELAQEIIKNYVARDGVLGYLIYCLVIIVLLVLFAYMGSKACPELVEHINISPIK